MPPSPSPSPVSPRLHSPTSSSSSDFRIQAITKPNPTPQNHLPSSPSPSTSSHVHIHTVSNPDPLPRQKPASKQSHSAHHARTQSTCLVPYLSDSDDSHPSSDEQNALQPEQVQPKKKRVRFANDVESNKRPRVQTSPFHSDPAPHAALAQVLQEDEIDEEAAIVTELARFEVAVADINRDNETVTTDILHAEDMREEHEQETLEQRVKQLRRRISVQATHNTHQLLDHNGHGGDDDNNHNSDDNDDNDDADIHIRGVLQASSQFT